MGYVHERHVRDNKVGMDLLARGTVQPVGHNFLVRAVQVVQAYHNFPV